MLQGNVQGSIDFLSGKLCFLMIVLWMTQLWPPTATTRASQLCLLLALPAGPAADCAAPSAQGRAHPTTGAGGLPAPLCGALQETGHLSTALQAKHLFLIDADTTRNAES